MTDAAQKAKELKAKADAVQAEATAWVEELFRRTLEEVPHLTGIKWGAIPNSYNDEGMYCEGHIILFSDELDAQDRSIHDAYYGPDDADGVWSDDNWYGKDYVPENKDTAIAKVLFEAVNKLKDVLGMNGESYKIEVYK